MIQRLFYWYSYLFGRAGWDTGIVPPEIVTLIEDEKLPAGRAIDLGCGTGTTLIYLAQRGWRGVGIDYLPYPIRTARRKARQAGVVGQLRFVVGDVTKLDNMSLGADFDLAVDIGCGHSLPAQSRPVYARSLARLVRPGGLLMTYMFRPSPERAIGLEPPEVEALFAPSFRLIWSSLGEDTSAHANSGWYRFVREDRS
jgi:SAM-dependent methyltransferase